ncbi:hypothetical protein CDO52_06885 [Nocardiopsis gilva YIM 90087]|uniref:Uncharacterized protein n=1 Tax=Nocardiopsis gilva YIM 90087 TaxID=1235441 RepID=A0A223S341_9ACTN|nr:tetrahydrofolate dehydrogenase/cyclohydrolase catalytic domain-containing protein [Nocardiopsis gilva]ASU82544.1 hypothetical protein CDO52_06885 [Nocardiopsis gilva YIM 90087]
MGYRKDIVRSGKIVEIIRFESDSGVPDVRRRLEAARVSAEQKSKNLSSIGFGVREEILDYDSPINDLLERVDVANSSPEVTGIIVQMPVRHPLGRAISEISPDKDIDALTGERSPYRSCATADGIVRVADPFLDDSSVTAVVGGRGFVGQGVVGLLRDRGIEPIVLDIGDDLGVVRQADVVISATGSPGTLGREHLHSGHRLVIDSGFVPQEDGAISGDVRKDAAFLPEVITPVPGGVGPVEMAVLMERAVQKEVDPSIPSWKVSMDVVRDRYQEHSPRDPGQQDLMHHTFVVPGQGYPNLPEYSRHPPEAASADLGASVGHPASEVTDRTVASESPYASGGEPGKSGATVATPGSAEGRESRERAARSHRLAERLRQFAQERREQPEQREASRADASEERLRSRNDTERLQARGPDGPTLA